MTIYPHALDNLDEVPVLLRHRVCRLVDIFHALQKSLPRDVQHTVHVGANGKALLRLLGQRERLGHPAS